jgi:protein SCO1/2
MKVLVAALLALLAGTSAAQAAAPRLHGVVLGLDAQHGEAIVHHDPFGGMPAMTMAFRVVPRALVGTLQAGTTIDATVDERTDPWTLRDVTVGTAQPVTASPSMRRVQALQAGDLVPDVPLLDEHGAPFRFSQLRGRDVILAFIYTRCQDPRMCPLISAKFHRLQQLAGARPLQLVEVSLDPAYDRPPVLARYARMFGADPARWTLAVGDADPTLDFAARFGVTAFPDPNYGLVHSEDTVEIDGDGRIRAMLPDADWRPEDLLADIDAIDGRGVNPLERFSVWLERGEFALRDAVANALGGIAGAALLLVLAFVAIGYVLVRIARGIFARNA